MIHWDPSQNHQYSSGVRSVGIWTTNSSIRRFHAPAPHPFPPTQQHASDSRTRYVVARVGANEECLRDFPSIEKATFGEPEQTPAPPMEKQIISGIFRGTELYAVRRDKLATATVEPWRLMVVPVSAFITFCAGFDENKRYRTIKAIGA